MELNDLFCFEILLNFNCEIKKTQSNLWDIKVTAWQIIQFELVVTMDGF